MATQFTLGRSLIIRRQRSPCEQHAAVLEMILDAQYRLDQKLDQVLLELRASSRPHYLDQADRDLALRIREAVGDHVCTSRELIDHAQIDHALRDALLACDWRHES